MSHVTRSSLAWLVPLCLLSGVLFTGLGCSGQPVMASVPAFPVTGKVLLNERPLAKALVVFYPVNPPEGASYRGYAHTGQDGSFTLSTFVPHDGAPAGAYRVTVQMQDEGDGPVRVPTRYADPGTSGILVDVKQGSNVLPTIHLRNP